MKKTFLGTLVLALGLVHQNVAKNYYVSVQDGNDAFTGLDSAHPIKSIAQANQLSLQAGDSLLFKRGETFRGNLVLSHSGTVTQPIVVSAYGMGSKPIISGAQNLIGTQQQNNSYLLQCNDCPEVLTQIYINEKLHIPARFPNQGYITMDAVNPSSVEASQLDSPSHTWDSAYMHVRTTQWIIDRFMVKNQTPKHIEYSKPNSFYKSVDPQAYFGFFLSGKLAALDTAGEWHFDARTKQIQIIPLNSTALANKGAEVSIYKNCITLAPLLRYVTIQNLQLEKSLSDALFMDQTQFITIQSCSIRQSGKDGIGAFENYQTANEDVNILQCDISDINNTGINMPVSKHLRIEHNTVKRCGLIPGLGQYYDQAYDGIFCNKALVLHNIVDSIGYIGIQFVDQDTVMYNSVRYTGLTKSDCGPFYCWKGSYNYVAYNFASYGMANGQGTIYPQNNLSFGIYCDDYSHHNTYEYNTSFNNEVGFMLHNSAHIQFRNNVLYNNTKAQIQILEGAPYSAKIEVHDNLITDNVLQCMHPSQLTLLLSSEKNNLASMAQFKGNYYGNAFNPYHIAAVYRPIQEDPMYSNRYMSYSLQDFQNAFGFDLLGKEAFEAPQSYGKLRKTSSNYIANPGFEQNTGWWWIYDDGGKFSISRDASGYTGMSNKVLKGNYIDTLGIQQGNWGTSPLSIQEHKKYMLTYQIAGQKPGGMRLNINSSARPYSGMVVPSSQYRPFGTDTRRDTLLFTGNNNGDASLTFNSTNKDGNFWMDNVEFYEVEEDTSTSTPFLKTVLFQNQSNIPKTLAVADQYHTVLGTLITKDVVLPAYGSIVLKKKDSFINSIRTETGSTNSWHLFPNPITDKLFLQKPSKETTLTISDLNGIELFSGIYQEEGFQIPSHWPQGLYILHVREAEKQAVYKFILQR